MPNYLACYATVLRQIKKKSNLFVLQIGMSVPWEMVAASNDVLTVQAPTGVSAILDIYHRKMARSVRM